MADEWHDNGPQDLILLSLCIQIAIDNMVLLRGGQLIIMSVMDQIEWHQTHGQHGFDVFDTIPLQLLPRVCPPQIWCHEPPVDKVNGVSCP